MVEARDLPLFPADPVDLTAAELKRLTVDAFPGSWARENVWAGFERLLSQLAQLRTPIELYVDGSFVTDKRTPADIDVLIVARHRDLTAPQITALADLQRSRETWLRQHRCDLSVLFDLPAVALEREIDQALSGFALNFAGPPKRAIRLHLGG